MIIDISFDDCTIEDIHIDALMTKYKLNDKITYFWPAMPKVVNEPKGRKSLENKDMYSIASRSKIGSHTISHRLLTRIPIEDARLEITDSRKILQDKFNQEISSFAYPRGYSNPDLQKLVQEAGYQDARGVSVGYIYRSENQYDRRTTVHVGQNRDDYGGRDWFSYALYMLDLARNSPYSVYSIFGHSWELAKYPNGFELFEQLLKQIRGV